jgi:hypothetical protein
MSSVIKNLVINAFSIIVAAASGADDRTARFGARHGLRHNLAHGSSHHGGKGMAATERLNHKGHQDHQREPRSYAFLDVLGALGGEQNSSRPVQTLTDTSARTGVAPP